MAGRIAGSQRPGPGAIFLGNGSPLTVGMFVDVPCRLGGRIVAWDLLADASGDAVIDIRVDDFGTDPEAVDSICGTAKPELTADKSAQSSGPPFADGDPVIPPNSTVRIFLEEVDGTIESIAFETVIV